LSKKIRGRDLPVATNDDEVRYSVDETACWSFEAETHYDQTDKPCGLDTYVSYSTRFLDAAATLFPQLFDGMIQLTPAGFVEVFKKGRGEHGFWIGDARSRAAALKLWAEAIADCQKFLAETPTYGESDEQAGWTAEMANRVIAAAEMANGVRGAKTDAPPAQAEFANGVASPRPAKSDIIPTKV
jgi:hypothetical protein